MDALRDAMKGLVRGTIVGRIRDDLRPDLLMVSSGRHAIFFDANQSRILILRILHDSMDYARHLNAPPRSTDQ